MNKKSIKSQKKGAHKLIGFGIASFIIILLIRILINDSFTDKLLPLFSIPATISVLAILAGFIMSTIIEIDSEK